MKVLDIYDVYCFDFWKKDGVMKYEATGKVKSEKYFPIYGEYIFKPLSKTKPLTTPLFAYSEVFWSYFIQKYFEDRAPRYYLAKCFNLECEFPKYYSIGTIVKNVTTKNQKLVNLLEYFNSHPEEGVDISEYTNYCEKLYDYTFILNAPIFKKNDNLRHKLENQILLSILKQDENFHYENVSFIEEENNIIDLCPTLDSEFSSFFLYPDNEEKYKKRKRALNQCLDLPFCLSKIDYTKRVMSLLRFQLMTSLNNIKNIIVQDYEVVEIFIKKLSLLIEEIEDMDILFLNNNFFQTLNSDSWEIGMARFKNNNEEIAKNLENSLKWYNLDSIKFSDKLKNECLESFKNLKFNLEVLMYLYKNNSLTDDTCLMEYPTVETAFVMMGVNINEEVYNNLSIDEKLNLLHLKEKVKSVV